MSRNIVILIKLYFNIFLIFELDKLINDSIKTKKTFKMYFKINAVLRSNLLILIKDVVKIVIIINNSDIKSCFDTLFFMITGKLIAKYIRKSSKYIGISKFKKDNLKKGIGKEIPIANIKALFILLSFISTKSTTTFNYKIYDFVYKNF